jgi:hypothetical protein
LLVAHSRGQALDSVDSAGLANVVIDSLVMTTSSGADLHSSGRPWPGRGHGIGSSETVSPSNNVRLDDTLFIVANLTDKYGRFPTVRHIPSTARTRRHDVA